jgi:hypothetical protein
MINFINYFILIITFLVKYLVKYNKLIMFCGVFLDPLSVAMKELGKLDVELATENGDAFNDNLLREIAEAKEWVKDLGLDDEEGELIPGMVGRDRVWSDWADTFQEFENVENLVKEWKKEEREKKRRERAEKKRKEKEEKDRVEAEKKKKEIEEGLAGFMSTREDRLTGLKRRFEQDIKELKPLGPKAKALKKEMERPNYAKIPTSLERTMKLSCGYIPK